MKNTITIADDGKLKTSEILNKCRKLFSVWSYYDDNKLDKDFPPVKTKRTFLYQQEADEELKNLSANDLEKRGGEYITLRERLFYELEYFKKEGKHLDVNNLTLCAGSRFSDGSVPRVCWDGGRLWVDWCGPGGAGGGLRARGVVKINLKSSDSFNLETIKVVIGNKKYKLVEV